MHPSRPITGGASRRLHGQRGEGVISAAIVVLIMAFLGAAMWVVFRRVFGNATDQTENEVSRIGQP